MRPHGASRGVAQVDVGVRAEAATGTLPHRDINFELWTQKFVGGSGNLDAILLDAFLPNETFANRVELYPNKLLNLERRTLRMGSITYVPYTVTNYVVSNCRLSLYLSLFLLLVFVLLIVLVIVMLVVVLVVIVVVVAFVVGTPKAHTNVGDLHAGIKQSQLVVLPHSPISISHSLIPTPHLSSPAPNRTLSTMLCPRRIRALCQVVMNIWPAVASPRLPLSLSLSLCLSLSLFPSLI